MCPPSFPPFLSLRPPLPPVESTCGHQREVSQLSRIKHMPKRYLLIAVSFGISLLLYVDRACISAATDEIRADLSFSQEEMGWILSIFALGYALGQTPSGFLADRYGPRLVLAIVAAGWSVFTALTGLVREFFAMLGVRFLFGVCEAGAYPTMARGFFSWLPARERGVTHGVSFSGGRIGAAIAFPVAVWIIGQWNWQAMFLMLGGIGIVVAVAWYVWFRNEPAHMKSISSEELAYIESARKAEASAHTQQGDLANRSSIFASTNMWLLMAQYVCSNFTFFFMLSWSFKYLKDQYDLSDGQAALYNMIPLLCGAVGNWLAGPAIDVLFHRGHWAWSRRLPAMIGFALAAVGMLVSLTADTPAVAVAWISLAVFGADMTLSPSWTTCNDVGRTRSGVVSGTMNMAGNLGSFLTSLAFPYLLAWSGSHQPFFWLAAGLNLVAIALWLRIHPDRTIEEC